MHLSAKMDFSVRVSGRLARHITSSLLLSAHPEFSWLVFGGSTLFFIGTSCCETTQASGFHHAWPRRAVSVISSLTGGWGDSTPAPKTAYGNFFSTKWGSLLAIPTVTLQRYSSASLGLSSSVSTQCPGLTTHSSFGPGGRTTLPTESVTQEDHIRRMRKVRPSIQGGSGQELHLLLGVRSAMLRAVLDLP